MRFAEFVTALFGLCNLARVLAYIPQLVKIWRDADGAKAVSLGTWGLFTVSNLSTVAYALAVAEDQRMAAVFAGNAGCCIAIVVLTAAKRRA